MGPAAGHDSERFESPAAIHAIAFADSKGPNSEIPIFCDCSSAGRSLLYATEEARDLLVFLLREQGEMHKRAQENGDMGTRGTLFSKFWCPAGSGRRGQ
ncbi:MAG: hypothetical protein CMJ95_14290 [Planctomycetes bacterium]|nr:hypothetical protein [Planctomycetota bacterium]